jgi:hypothetical protein
MKIFEYKTEIKSADTKGGHYVVFPYDIRKIFGKGRVKAAANFDGELYNGSIVNMGVKNNDGTICYIIGIQKKILHKINKKVGDTINIKITV